MKNLIGTYNANYRIEKQIYVYAKTSIVWAYNKRLNQFASWIAIEQNDETINFHHGHYINRETKSLLDFYKRVEREIKYHIQWLEEKLSYEIQNEIER